MTDRLQLLTRYAQEVVTEEDLKAALEKKKPTAYMGYAPTGQLHIGHFIPIMKIADFLDAGIHFKFLIADVHAYLDDQKTPWELLDARSEYYEKCIRGMVEACGTDPKKLEFVRGSSFQFKEDYMKDVLRMAGSVTFNRVKRAASEVVRFGDAPKLGGFIYPLLQIEDVRALGADITLSGVDQRGIYMLGRELLPEIGGKSYACVFTPLLPSLAGGKMGGKMSSSAGNKIAATAIAADVREKMNCAYCVPGEVEGNSILMFLKQVIFPLKEKKHEHVVVERPVKYGGNAEYADYKALEADFAAKKIHPLDLKNTLAKELCELTAPVCKAVPQSVLDKAYPTK
jgi:tyrosyl-tRNA synthetase